MKISERQRKVLEVLVERHHEEDNCLYFRCIADRSGLDVRESRIAARALVRKGLAEYVRGLFDDDGMVAGSGYCSTTAGKILIEAIEATAETKHAYPVNARKC